MCLSPGCRLGWGQEATRLRALLFGTLLALGVAIGAVGQDGASNAVRVQRTLTISEFGDTRTQSVTTFTGEFERTVRTQIGDLTPEQALIDSKGRIPGYLLGNWRVESIDFVRADDLSEPFTFRMAGRQRRFRVHGAPRLTYSHGDQFLRHLPSSLGTPGEPFTIEVLYVYEVATRYFPPPGFTVQSLPPLTAESIGPVNFTRRVTRQPDGSILSDTRFDTGDGVLGPEEANTLRSWVVRVRSERASGIRFENATELHLGANRIREALDSARHEVELDPNNPVYRTRLVKALLAAGAGHSARREATQAVERAPLESAAYFALGLALSHDLMGRRDHPDQDAVGAATAFRTALDLSGRGLPLFGYRLARALSKGDDGLAFGKGARADEAIETARRVFERTRSIESLARLTHYLAQTGQFDKVRELLDVRTFEHLPRAQRRMLGRLIQAVAMQEGVEAALVRAETLGANRADALHSAAEYLAHARLYKSAAAVFDAAADAAEEGNRTYLFQSAAHMRRMRRNEEFGAGGPLGAAIDWLRAIHLAPDWRTSIQSIVSSCGKLELRDRAISASYNAWAEWVRNSQSATATNYERNLDQALSLALIEVAGDDATGYLVRANWPGGHPADQIDFFIVMEAGRYKVLETAESEESALVDLACEVRRRTDSGDLAAAAKLIEWAGEINPSTGLNQLIASWEAKRSLRAQGARLGAAILSAADPTRAVDADRVLSEALRSPEWTSAQSAIRRGRVRALEVLGRYEEALELATVELNQRSRKMAMLPLVVDLLGRLDRWNDAFGLIDGVASDKDASGLMRLKLLTARRARRLGIAMEAALALQTLGGVTSEDHNNLAWAAVASGRVDEFARDHADEAAKPLELFRGRAMITQAAVNAMLDEPEIGRRFLLDSMRWLRLLHPGAEEWFVHGLIMESYGLPDDARAAYRSAIAAHAGYLHPGEPAALAEIRLEAMQ